MFSIFPVIEQLLTSENLLIGYYRKLSASSSVLVPPLSSICKCSSLYTTGTSLYFSPSGEIYKSTLLYRDLGMRNGFSASGYWKNKKMFFTNKCVPRNNKRVPRNNSLVNMNNFIEQLLAMPTGNSVVDSAKWWKVGKMHWLKITLFRTIPCVKYSNSECFLILIFLYSDWIRRFTL